MDGAHQLRNDSAAEVRLLIVSTMVAPEVNVFPDTGELWVRDYIPGTDAAGRRVRRPRATPGDDR